jgi:hypothetical protein
MIVYLGKANLTLIFKPSMEFMENHGPKPSGRAWLAPKHVDGEASTTKHKGMG